jgi:C-terminal processing protease CtpA/Prc
MLTNDQKTPLDTKMKKMKLIKLNPFTPRLLNYLGLTLPKIYHLKRSISYSKITYVSTFLLFASPIRAQIAETFYSKNEIIEDLNYVIDRFDHLAPKPYIRSDSLSIRLKKDSIISTLSDSVSTIKGEYKKTGINNSSSTIISGDPFFTDFKEDSIAQITIKRFSGFKRKTWHHFLEKSFQEISNRGTPYLMIDIRGNEGGNSTYLRELAAYLSKENISFEGKMIRKTTLESKRYFRNYFFKWYTYPLYPLILLNREARGVLVGKDGSIHISNENPEKLPKVSYPYSGKVFLMTDRGTYSTASMLASCFQCYGIAKIIGIGSGEPTIGDGDAVDITLSNTGCRFSVGTAIWFNPCFEKADQNQMLIPDIHCEQGTEYEFLLKYLKLKQ